MVHGDGGSMKMDMGMDMGGMDMSDGGMSMTFGNNWRGASVLFSFWTINTGFSYFLSLIVVALFCIFYEYLTAIHENYDAAIIDRQLREKQRQTDTENDNGNCCNDAADERTKLTAVNVNSFQRSSGGVTVAAPSAPRLSSTQNSSLSRVSSSLGCGAIFNVTEFPIDFNVTEQLIRSLLYGARAFVSLCVMMIFMLMDVGLVAAIIVGYILGYFAFQKHTTIAANQHVKQYKAAGCH